MKDAPHAGELPSLGESVERASPATRGSASVGASGLTPAPQPRARVLVADADAALQAHVRRSLDERHFVVQAVADGEAALRAVRESRPDLVLADATPLLDGFDLLRAVRRDAALCDLRLIILSPRADEPSRTAAFDAGADDYLIKPFSAHELIARVTANLQLTPLYREAIAATRASEDRYRALVTASSSVVYRMSPDWHQMHYLDGHDFIADTRSPTGKWLDSYIHPDDQPTVTKAIGDAIRAKSMFELEHRVRRVDGSLGWMLSRAVPILDPAGNITEWFGAAIDVTARKEAETSLHRNQTWLAAQKEAFQTAVNGAPLDMSLGVLMRAAIAQYSGDVRCAFYIADAEGAELHHVAGMSDAYARAVDGFKIGPDSLVCGLAVHLGQPVVTRDVREEPRWKEWLWLAEEHGYRGCWSFPVETAAGKIVGSFAMYFKEPREATPQDRELAAAMTQAAAIIISRHQASEERKAAEEALRNLNAALDAQVRERTRALENALEERRVAEAALQQAQRLEAIGQLTGGVAHDFNNLLTVVIGQTEAIIASADGNDRIIRMATAAQRAAERGAQLTGQLLSFARRQQLRLVSMDIHSLIASSVDLARRAVGESVTVELDIEARLWPCRLDSAQFESAILNLAINARDAMPNGGRLTIQAGNASLAEAEARRLDLSDGDYLIVRVTDTGLGMSPEVLRRAFEPFFTTKDVGAGTGLGLSQIYGFVRQSGGTVTIDSTVGQGTSVAMYFPRAASGIEEPEDSNEPAPRLQVHDRNVLLVEDQPDIRQVLQLSLEELGFRVLTAPDGVAARKRLEGNEAIDLLLTDVVMPNGISGLELARDARKRRPGLKVLLISGYLRDHQSDVVDLSDFLLLQKPFKHAQLVEAVAAAFKGVSGSIMGSIGD